MATAYAGNTYKQNPLRSTLFEAIYAPTEHAGIQYVQWFTGAIPVGFSNVAPDVFKCFDIQAGCPVTVPQYAAVRFQRVVLRCGGNVGGTMTANFGTIGAPTAFGAALATLQSATTLDVAIATIMAGPAIIVSDTLQLVMSAAGPTTTLQTVDGFAQYSISAP